jgi:ATP-binding cassette subfamily B protein
LSRSFLEFFEYLGNISDGVSIFVQSHEIVDKPDAPRLQVPRGEIAFEDITFIYPEGMAIFERLNVTIEPKQQVGLVGFSGSGKSTFVNLILRLFECQSGRIRIDGQDILDVTQDSLREHVSMIPQDPIMPMNSSCKRKRVTIRWWASAASSCPAASGSGLPLRAPS